jgi:signal peptidase I
VRHDLAAGDRDRLDAADGGGGPVNMRLRPMRDLFAFSCLILVGFAWWFFAPPALGGKTNYAVIFGISMEPKFHRGDLVLIRKADSYHVGEIVAYHSHSLHRAVLHRIRAYHNGRYTFKGDNNAFVDPEHPTADQLFGREWIHVPGVGTWLEKARSPKNSALIGAITAFMLLVGGGATTRKRRRRRRPPVPATPAAAHAPVQLKQSGNGTLRVPLAHEPVTTPGRTVTPMPTHPRSHAWVGYLGLTAVAIGLAALAGTAVVAGVAYSRPLQRVVTQSNLYTVKGHFDMSATAPVGPVYDHAQLSGTDPLFLNLVHEADFTFQTTLVSNDTAQLTCQGSFDAFLSDGNGWRRHLSLVPQTPCTSGNATLTGHVSIDRLVGLARKFEKTTGSHALQYTFLLVPHVEMRGTVGNQPVDVNFKPSLAYRLQSDRLVLPTDSPGGQNLDRAQTANGKTTIKQSMGPMAVSDVRHMALIGIPLTLLVAILGGLLFLVVRKNDEVSSILRRYGPWMIDVAAADRPAHLERRVESMDALSRIAERYERLIMHEQRGGLHSFLVEDDGVVYRYDAYEKSPWRGDPVHYAGPVEQHTPTVPAPDHER